jgi:magnesium chelatase family protein
MLASRLPSILPAVTNEEALEAAAVASVSFTGFDKNNWKQRAFRAPHHSASTVALVGGSNPPKPGEISLAHHGVLFLDELPEFNRQVIEALREPLEAGFITISRAARQSQFPAKFQLIAAMNPCPCGFHGDTEKACSCSPDQINRYQAKLSGPFLDRIDLFATVSRVSALTLVRAKKTQEESSAVVQQRVDKARAIQLQRAGVINARLDGDELERFCELGEAERELVEKMISQFDLSARAYHRALRVARTIADLDAQPKVLARHLKEAFGFRRV